jgi:hypothetical protein
MSFPKTIRATDLGEFWTDTEVHPLDDTPVLVCQDPDGGAVQPDTPAMELMKEMARRYNLYTMRNRT